MIGERRRSCQFDPALKCSPGSFIFNMIRNLISTIAILKKYIEQSSLQLNRIQDQAPKGHKED